MRHALLAGVLLAAPWFAACGNSPTTPTISTTVDTRTTEVFSGTLNIGDSLFFAFNTTIAGKTDVMLASVRTLANVPLTSAFQLALGVPSDISCNPTVSQIVTAAGLTSQITSATTAIRYCVNIADIGNLSDTAAFTIRIVHP